MNFYHQLSKIYKIFEYLNVVSKKRTLFLISLLLSVMVFEAMSIVSIMPLIKFIQLNQDIDLFRTTTDYGNKIILFYDYFSIPFSTFSLTICVALLFFIRQTFKLIENIETEKTRLQITKNLSIICFKNILNAKAEYIRTFKIGNLTALCESECARSSFLYKSFLGLVGLVAQLLGYVGLMFFVSPIITTLAIFSLVLIISSNTFLVKKSHIAGKDVVVIRNNFYGYLSEHLGLWRLSKFRNIVNEEEVKITSLANQYANKLLLFVRYSAFSRLLIAACIMILCIFILTLSANNLDLNFEKFTLFTIILIRLIPIGQQFASYFNSIATYLPSITYIFQVIKKSNENKEELDNGKKFYKLNKCIQFKNVFFSYTNDKIGVINNLNLYIPANKFTILLGRSGSGKSTLIDLLPRIIKEQKGSIFLDDININKYSLRSLRNNISYVPQESLLIDGTIKENICYFNKNPSKRDLIEAIKLSGAEEFIKQYKDGIYAKITEKGSNISGGQKQRIVLARAFLSRSPILILDEATSAMDAYLEKNFKRAINKLKRKKNKTIIMITHKLNLAEEADFVASISKGKIDKFGKAKEFLANYKFKENR
tara:strand:- start:4568 stop:6358 length:1791 start_codon:yes stop_codon:yes gene_type:complete